jgi:hypothetical protein
VREGSFKEIHIVVEVLFLQSVYLFDLFWCETISHGEFQQSRSALSGTLGPNPLGIACTDDDKSQYHTREESLTKTSRLGFVEAAILLLDFVELCFDPVVKDSTCRRSAAGCGSTHFRGFRAPRGTEDY